MPKKSEPSAVEQLAAGLSGEQLQYRPFEKTAVITVSHFPALGRLTALRFLEWTQRHPGGVISLPTGKTPEHFIRFVRHYLETWSKPATRKELEKYGVDPAVKPDMQSLHFVQIDEFYPIEPAQHNSFYYYVNKYYLGDFGLDRKKALLIDSSRIGLPAGSALADIWPEGDVDLSLRYRYPANKTERVQKGVLEQVDQWCCEYEDKIRSLGGIGFFLGGIGPDGHIAFNIMGSDHHTTTRLAHINYETQAASAGDLGGIEVARKRHAITIGLETITFNRDCTAIIMAAGESKAGVVADAVQQDASVRYPATALHKLPNARFYVTRGAAKLLEARRVQQFVQQKQYGKEDIEKAAIDVALHHNKRLVDLGSKEYRSHPFGRILIGKVPHSPEELGRTVRADLLRKIEDGRIALSDKRFLHTAPHHDDIMLGYFPYVVRHIRKPENSHHFAYMTSGFNAVTNKYALSLLDRLHAWLETDACRALIGERYFDPGDSACRNRDMWQYLDGVAARSNYMRREGESRRMLRNLMEIFDEKEPRNLLPRIPELQHYLRTQYAGKKDLPYIQMLKGMIREWEADCLWGYLGFAADRVHHLRLGFYKGDIFTENPTVSRDVMPVLGLMRKVRPDIVTVALDPEASGPDTHYKVLQTAAESLQLYEKESGNHDIEVWGYRNVWYRFHPAEVNCCIPVSLNMMAITASAFDNAFMSQRDASFPSYELDGPFSALTQKIQVEQYQMMKTILGREYFNEHISPLIRGTRGFVFLKKMTLPEFYGHARGLKELVE